MVTVQMTLEEKLVKRVDELARKLRTSRSAFAREALKEALKRHYVLGLEKTHRQGYQKHPTKSKEFDVFENEQVWADE